MAIDQRGGGGHWLKLTLQNLESHILSLDFSIGFHGIGNWKLVTYTTLDYVKNSYPLPMPYLV